MPRARRRALLLAEREPRRPSSSTCFMPGMDGFEFLERFRRCPPAADTPVIVWTAKDLTADDHARLAASAQAVVLKGGHGAG